MTLFRRINLNKEFGNNVYVIADYDGDGFSSAWIIYNCLRKLGKKVKIRFYMRSSGRRISLTDIIKKIDSDKRYSSIIVLDLPLSKNVIKLKTKKKIFWVDHHSIEYVPKSKNIIFMNPRSKNQRLYIPTSCILFHVIPKDCLDEKTIFMCALGTLSDIGLDDCKDLYVKFSETFPGYFDVNKIEKYEKTKLFKYVKLLNSALLLNRTSSSLNKLLRKIKDPVSNILSREFEKYQKIVDREVEKEIERFRRKRIQLDKNVFFYLMKTRLPVKTVVAYKLAKKYRSKIVLIGQKISGSKISISARRGSLVKENLIDALSKFSEKLGLITYGGHPKAAGAIADVRKMKLEL